MARHDHREHRGEGLTEAAQAALTEAGEQWTVSALRGKRIAANSVYRILDLFVRTNLARRVESANAYVANSHPGCRHDCIFLICDSCGQAVHLDDDRLTGALVSAAKGAGFADVRPVVELRGHCAECS
jgi:Fur family transcriptional regulator, zinc uptake regulator